MDKIQIKSEIEKTVKEMENELVDLSCKFVSFNSVNPKTNGPGEKEVALWLENVVKKMGFDKIIHIDAKDSQVPYGYRPNILSILNGQSDEKTIWLMTHMDKVPAGDLSLWDNDPFKPVIKDGKIYGRGAEDNGSSLVASIIALKAILKLGIKPRYNVGLMFVSDEETGSEFGIEYVVNNFKFGKDDWFIVPDSGNPVGNEIEIAEKSIIWLKMTTVGKQAHASMPQLAKNAHRVGIKCALEIDNFIHEKYNSEDPLFTPSVSTFEQRKKKQMLKMLTQSLELMLSVLMEEYYHLMTLKKYSLKLEKLQINMKKSMMLASSLRFSRKESLLNLHLQITRL